MSSPQLLDRPATVTDEPAPRPGRAAMRKARSHRFRRQTPLLARYLGYVGYFVGAGLISGAVVHHPLDPARYTQIAGCGVLVFLAATVLNEFFLARHRPALPRMLQIIGASLMLSFGIGMLSGGLQHFDDFPDRAAILVPLGITVSFIAFVLRDAETSWRRIFSPVGMAVLVTALITFAGLRQLAAGISEQPEGGGHSHGSEEPAEHAEPTAGDGQNENSTTTPAPQTPTSARTPGAGEKEGHSH
ncbi:hypothetical protein [Streptomyces sp. A5-4]|uniref:hypothetical protein n=1 Tax=Streptomyces sp. A5-4 TaxID=3384771 RepID=UPI003DA9CFED